EAVNASAATCGASPPSVHPRRSDMKTRNVVLAGLAGLALAGAGLPAFAQQPKAPGAAAKKSPVAKQEAEENRAQYEKRFKAADKNGDGGLNQAELKAQTGKFTNIQGNFAAMDTN